MLCKLLEDTRNCAKIDFAKLLKDIMFSLKTHVSTELRSTLKNDKVLIGYLNLIERVLRISPDEAFPHLNNDAEATDFALYLFNECLFTNYPEKLLYEDL